MKEASEQKTGAREEYFARLIEKLFLDTSLIGIERDGYRPDIIHTFCNEYGDYTLCVKKISRQDIWIIAERPTQASHL